MPEPPSRQLAVVVVSYNSAGHLELNLPRLADPRIETIVVDNRSSDGSAALVKRIAGVHLIERESNVGWASACNLGAASSRAPYLAFVNPDAGPTPDQLMALVDRLGPRQKAVAPRFVGDDGEPQGFYYRLPSLLAGALLFTPAGSRIDAHLGNPVLRWWTYGNGDELPCEVDQPGAACLVIERDTFVALGGFEESYFLYFADTDLYAQMRRKRIDRGVAWDVRVPHSGGASVSRLTEDARLEVILRDWVVFAHRQRGWYGRMVARAAVVLFTAILPASHALLAGDKAKVRRRIDLTRRVLAGEWPPVVEQEDCFSATRLPATEAHWN